MCSHNYCLVFTPCAQRVKQSLLVSILSLSKLSKVTIQLKENSKTLKMILANTVVPIQILMKFLAATAEHTPKSSEKLMGMFSLISCYPLEVTTYYDRGRQTWFEKKIQQN